MTMPAGEFMAILDKRAKAYRPGADASIRRNTHMNEVTEGEAIPANLIDAILVDFINHVAGGFGMDYGMYTRDLQKGKVTE